MKKVQILLEGYNQSHQNVEPSEAALVALQGEAFWGLLKNGKPFLTYILMLSEFWKTHLDRIGMKLSYLHFESKVK